MPESSFPPVRLSAVAITRGAAYLTVFNSRWGSFTLPMSKRRTLIDPDLAAPAEEETPLATAIRAAAEVLGRPLGPGELPTPIGPESLGHGVGLSYNQSGRDGVWRCYHFDVFELRLAPGEEARTSGGPSTAWLTLEQMELAQPVSPTALMIVRSIQGEKFLRGGA